MKKIAEHQDFLIGTLAYALYWMDESLQASLEAAGWERMNRTKSMIMINITVGVNRPAHLARHLGVSRQAIHQLLQSMRDDGLLELVPDPADKRAKIVQFSSSADHIREDAEKAVIGIETQLADRIGKSQLKQLKQALAKGWGPVVVVPPQ
jgi:DNA-binding MarR family transcriptional regulator